MNSVPTPKYFGVEIYPNKDGIPVRTCPHPSCATLGLVFTGTFEIASTDIWDEYGQEYVEINIFDDFLGWLPLDYSKMNTVFKRPPNKTIIRYEGREGDDTGKGFDYNAD